ncbi:YlxR family protein [Pseudonocardia sp.]|uniref:YlxR family protein n=1 Tax=Pseudonocardia sp. TaxID=60912 RepID=UPI003D11CEF8
MAHRHPQRRGPAGHGACRRGRPGGGGLKPAGRDRGSFGTLVTAGDGGPGQVGRRAGDGVHSPQPVRTCVGCRTRAPAGSLLRVVAVHGVLTPDPDRRLPGRGAWLHPERECLHRAERRSAFSRALRVEGPLDAGAVRRYLEQVCAGPGTPPGPSGAESRVDPS